MTSSPITRQMGLWCACLCSHQLMVATFSTRISGQASWKKAYVLLDKPSVKLSLIRYCPVHETYGWIWFSWIVRPSQVVISCQADFFFTAIPASIFSTFPLHIFHHISTFFLLSKCYRGLDSGTYRDQRARAKVLQLAQLYWPSTTSLLDPLLNVKRPGKGSWRGFKVVGGFKLQKTWIYAT